MNSFVSDNEGTVNPEDSQQLASETQHPTQPEEMEEMFRIRVLMPKAVDHTFAHGE